MLGLLCDLIWGVVPGVCVCVGVFTFTRCVLYSCKLDLNHSLRMITKDESYARTMGISEICVGPVGQMGTLAISDSHQTSLGRDKLCLCSEMMGFPSQDPVKVHL